MEKVLSYNFLEKTVKTIEIADTTKQIIKFFGNAIRED